MNKRVHILRRVAMASAMVVAMMVASSCNDGLGIFEDEGDCGVYISFKYDYNIKFADAFANEVNSIALYVFDQSNTLVDQITTTDKEALASDSFELELQLDPGKYRLLAWGGVMNEESFDIMANTEIGKTTIEELQVMMHRKISDDGTAYRDEDLLPLYHGLMEIDINDVDGEYRHTMSMVKNTNVVRILLHEMSGHPMSAEQYSFEITDRNGLYDYDNTRLDDEVITYKPWHMESIYAESETTRATEINAVLAELTLGRMSAASSPILCVKNTETGEEVLRIPIADYALLVKGHYRESMGDQEYLDRQDEYPMTLFLDEGEWVSSQIIINGWRVVINNTELN
jgi:hypothetical protein